tara:strand:- start:572 stop:1321 length:750 start_codon:yes stop_codon:yes gene_type:complete
MKNPEKVLYLNPLKLTGPDQMAIDLFLLEKSFSDKDFNMALRFYTWDGDWLSIGRNQRELPEKWIKLLKNKKLKIVKRPSGGKAVLHSMGLTYALIWKDPPKSKKESYVKTTQWLRNGFKKAGIELFSGDQPVNLSNNNCFATSTLADLVDKDKNKYVGSAQYWKRGHLLQHGEILMEPSRQLWKNIFNTEPPKIKKELREKDRIIYFLKESFSKTWTNSKWCDYNLKEKDRELIHHLSISYFNRITYL